MLLVERTVLVGESKVGLSLGVLAATGGAAARMVAVCLGVCQLKPTSLSPTAMCACADYASFRSSELRGTGYVQNAKEKIAMEGLQKSSY
jgi:hypothetical protein